jgi:hypothetical protein
LVIISYLETDSVFVAVAVAVAAGVEKIEVLASMLA